MDAVRVVLLTVHLLCMNVASAAPLLCIWLLVRGRRQSCEKTIHLVKSLALWSIGLLLLGIVLGLTLGAAAVVHGDRRLLETIPFFQKKIMWGVLELCCSVVWLLGYWGWLQWRPPKNKIATWTHACLAVLSATNLLYHFPGLLTVMSKVAHGEFNVTEPLDPASFRKLMFSADVVAHAVHFTLASLAVSGLFLSWLVRKDAERLVFDRTGARLSVAATALQLPVGLWLLAVTAPAPQNRLLGGELLTTSFFVASMLSAFYLLQNLAVLAFGDEDSRLATRCRWLMFLTVLMMSATLHVARG